MHILHYTLRYVTSLSSNTFVEFRRFDPKHPTKHSPLYLIFVTGMINGAIAGLVCITPAASFVDMNGAFFIGFFGGPLCYVGSQIKHYLGEASFIVFVVE